MMRSIVAVITPLLLFSFCAQALQERILSDAKRSVVNISRDEFNRISVVGDRIENVFGMSDQFMIESDEKNGQIFLGVKDKSKKNISITIVTESGKSQDVSMRVKEIPAETILFKEKPTLAENTKDGSKQDVRQLSDKERRGFLLKQMIKDKEIEGYAVITQAKQLAGFRHISCKKIKSYLGMFIGEVLHIKNISGFTVALQESDFSLGKKVKLISVAKRDLKPNESTLVYVVSDV